MHGDHDQRECGGERSLGDALHEVIVDLRLGDEGLGGRGCLVTEGEM